jgi:hypothetical protein
MNPPCKQPKVVPQEFFKYLKLFQKKLLIIDISTIKIPLEADYKPQILMTRKVLCYGQKEKEKEKKETHKGIMVKE